MKTILRMILVSFLAISSLGAKDVLISFDGSASLQMWQETLDYAKESKVKFTYFISAPYFIVENTPRANEYWATKKYNGFQPVAFRKTRTAYGIDRRRGYLDRAVEEGHEIGSHLCGHYDGSKWTKEEWALEMLFFEGTFIPYTIKSIRAPELGVNQAYFDALNKFAPHIQYDSSVVSGRQTRKFNYGRIKQVYVPEIRIINKPTSGYTLPFDYNFHLLQCSDEQLKKIFLDSMKNYYESTDGPFLICLHFEQMNNGIFYEAMKELVEWLKDKNPRYMTYAEYGASLETKKPEAPSDGLGLDTVHKIVIHNILFNN